MSIDNINESNENFYNDKKLKFLVSCTMKAIFGTDAGREVLQGNLELIMGEAKVGY